MTGKAYVSGATLLVLCIFLKLDTFPNHRLVPKLTQQTQNICIRFVQCWTNTKHLYKICTMLNQRRRRWADVVQMFCVCNIWGHGTISTDHPTTHKSRKILYKCFVFAIYADTERCPLIIRQHIKAVKYWCKILRLSQSHPVRNAYNMLLELDVI